MSESYHVIVEADDNRDDGTAAEVARILCEAYPGHPWHIRVGKGVIIIKHMKASSRFGMCQHYDRITFNAKVMKHDLVMAAGELLERAGLTRGRVIEGEVIQRVEGIAEKDLVPLAQRVLH